MNDPINTKTPQAVQACHALLEWMIPQLDKFPRVRRFTLGERIEAGLLEVLERLVEAAYSRDKAVVLQQANLRLDLVRHLWRLAYRLQAISGRRYEHGAQQMMALGRPRSRSGGQIAGQGRRYGARSRSENRLTYCGRPSLAPFPNHAR